MKAKDILSMFDVPYLDNEIKYLEDLHIRTHAYDQNYRADIQSAIRNLIRSIKQYKRARVIKLLEENGLIDKE